jgi:hypothetical protein
LSQRELRKLGVIMENLMTGLLTSNLTVDKRWLIKGVNQQLRRKEPLTFF